MEQRGVAGSSRGLFDKVVVLVKKLDSRCMNSLLARGKKGREKLSPWLEFGHGGAAGSSTWPRWAQVVTERPATFHELPPEAFPLLIECLNRAGQVVWSATIAGPGAIEIPALYAEHGMITARVTYATGEVYPPTPPAIESIGL